MNKYQEALDNVKDSYSYFDWLDGIKTLQELINQYEMLEDVCNQLTKENAKLENALKEWRKISNETK